MSTSRHRARFDLTGRTALVTGCRRGIGRAIAAALADAGADIIGVSASLEPGSDIEADVVTAGRSFTPIRADLAVRDDVYRVLEEVSGRRVDVLVANAGSNRRRPAADYTDEDWDFVIELNLSSFGFHGEKRLLETTRALGDFERTTRGSSINVRLEQRLPHHNLQVLVNWASGQLSTFAAEAGVLVKRFDDTAEHDVTDVELKGVLRLLFGK